MKLFSKKLFVILAFSAGSGSYVLAMEDMVEGRARQEPENVKSARLERERTETERIEVERQGKIRMEEATRLRKEATGAKWLRRLSPKFVLEEMANDIPAAETGLGRKMSGKELSDQLTLLEKTNNDAADEIEKEVKDKIREAKSKASDAYWTHIAEKIKNFFSRSAEPEPEYVAMNPTVHIKPMAKGKNIAKNFSEDEFVSMNSY